MTLEQIFIIVEKSNELQELLGRKRNGIRVELYEIKNGRTEIIKRVVTSHCMDIFKTFRSEKLQGLPIYKTEFVQTGDPQYFQSYFGKYMMEVKIVEGLEF